MPIGYWNQESRWHPSGLAVGGGVGGAAGLFARIRCASANEGILIKLALFRQGPSVGLSVQCVDSISTFLRATLLSRVNDVDVAEETR